jgi:hypothetical protein
LIQGDDPSPWHNSQAWVGRYDRRDDEVLLDEVERIGI